MYRQGNALDTRGRGGEGGGEISTPGPVSMGDIVKLAAQNLEDICPLFAACALCFQVTALPVSEPVRWAFRSCYKAYMAAGGVEK